MYEFVQDIGIIWQQASQEERCELAPMLFDKIYVEDGLVKQIMPTSALWALVFGCPLFVLTNEFRDVLRQWFDGIRIKLCVRLEAL
jgi:hypothetical protein